MRFVRTVAPQWHSVGIPLGIPVAFRWHSVGIQLAFSWHSVGIQLAFSWHSVGIQLAFSWHSVGHPSGIPLAFRWASQWYSVGIPLGIPVASLPANKAPENRTEADEAIGKRCGKSPKGRLSIEKSAIEVRGESQVKRV